MKLDNYEYYRTDLGVLYCGDCLEIIPLIEDKIDLVLTDPPYGIGLEYDNYNDSIINWKNMFLELIPILKIISQMIIMPCCQIKLLEWIYKKYPPDWLICWYKGSPGHRAYIGFNDWEPHLVYGKIKGLQMHDYFYAKCQIDKFSHPCPKSIQYAEKIINKATKNKMIVLDCFLGSGTTAVACEKLGRRWIGIEISEKYCEIAKKRIEAEACQIKMLL